MKHVLTMLCLLALIALPQLGWAQAQCCAGGVCEVGAAQGSPAAAPAGSVARGGVDAALVEEGIVPLDKLKYDPSLPLTTANYKEEHYPAGQLVPYDPPGHGYQYVPDARGYMRGRDYAGFHTELGPAERALDLGVVRLDWLDNGAHKTCACFVVKVIKHCDVLNDQGIVSGVAYPKDHPEKAKTLIMGRLRPGWWEGMFYPQSEGEWEMALRIKRCQVPDEIVYYQFQVTKNPSKNWRCYWMKVDCPGHGLE